MVVLQDCEHKLIFQLRRYLAVVEVTTEGLCNSVSVRLIDVTRCNFVDQITERNVRSTSVDLEYELLDVLYTELDDFLQIRSSLKSSNVPCNG